MKSSENDICIWLNELILKDSQESFRKLYLTFYSRLYLFIRNYVKSDEIAEELASDVFMLVWNKRKQLPDIQNFKSYIYIIARNLAISHLRKESGSGVDVEVDVLEKIHQSHDTPETELISAEAMKKLNKTIDSLPEKCRQTYQLVRDHDLKYKEVSEILNISVKTVESHMSLAIRKLREALSCELKK